MGIILRWTVVAVLGLLRAGPAWADSYDDAIAAGEKGDYDLSAKLLRPLAEAGDARAQGAFGSVYDRGLGVPVDHQRAFAWYLSATKQGNAGAEMNLCASYFEGVGVTQDIKEGMRWCFLAARQNLAEAHFNLGNCYFWGEYGLKRDELRAYMHFKLAFEHAPRPSLKQFAADSMEHMRRNMRSVDVAKAEQMAAAWPQELP